MSIIDGLLPQFKRHADISHDLDDEICLDHLEAAVSMIEKRYGVSIHRREMNEPLDVSSGFIRPTFIPDGMIISLGRGKHVLEADMALRVRPSNYPAVISYTAGYDEPKSIPPDVRQAIMKLASHLMEHRGDSLNRQSLGSSRAGIASVGDPIRDSGASVIMQPYGKVGI
jgi:hypothetical protein